MGMGVCVGAVCVGVCVKCSGREFVRGSVCGSVRGMCVVTAISTVCVNVCVAVCVNGSVRACVRGSLCGSVCGVCGVTCRSTICVTVVGVWCVNGCGRDGILRHSSHW